MKKLKIGKRTGLRYFDADDIRSWGPCYDPSRYVENGVRLNAVKVLEDGRIPHGDRLWCVLRPEIVSERAMRLFAVWCARQVQHLMKDPRSIAALDVAERFANGEATEAERDAAGYAARAAARAAATAAAGYAARAAATAAAGYAAGYAAGDAARDAAWAAAGDAARDAAWAAATAAARAAQVAKLIEMVRAEAKERKS
jgi:hypothetical protein